MAVIEGVGSLIANDLLTDAAYMLIQPSVNLAVPAGGIAIGPQIVPAYSPAMYIGAQIVVGVINGNLEVVVITAVVPGASFTAVFTNAHVAGEPIVGATFPVRSLADQLFTQSEMLAYLSTAVNDFLTDCPLIYNVAIVNVAPTAQNAALPQDCMVPMRMAVNNYPLRETSQSNLDSMDYRWQIEAATGPVSYFRDKTGLQQFGIAPRANNVTPVECLYAQRQPGLMGLGDGFLLPDPFLLYPLMLTLSFAFSKDGESRNPGLAKYFEGRYAYGVKIASMFLEAIMDPNLEMANS